MCPPGLAHYLWLNHSINESNSQDDSGGFEYEGNFVAAYDDRCEFCDICQSKVASLAFECRECSYGECEACLYSGKLHTCNGEELDSGAEMDAEKQPYWYQHRCLNRAATA